MKSIDIAKYVINKRNKLQAPISNLELQYLLYAIKKEFLELGINLFDESCEAWMWGPCFPSVYYTYCGFGSLPIQMNYEVFLNKGYKNIIDNVIIRKIDYQFYNYSSEIMGENSAWKQTYDKHGSHAIITNELIERFG